MKNAFAILLTICCLLSGYAFYLMNHGDLFNAICFTVGISGIMLSFLRNRNKSETALNDRNEI